MHCNVDGNVFAAVTDRQNIDISRVLNVGLPGATLSSLGTFSTPAEPEQRYRH